MKSIYSYVFFLIAFALAVTGCTRDTEKPLTPEESLEKFYSYEAPEELLMNPLISSGSEVVPLIMIEIQNKDMPRRRYAIGALGHIQDVSALPALLGILNDGGEKDYFRCDALKAIGMIDFEQAKNLAGNYEKDSIECLSRLSNELLVSDYESWFSENPIISKP